MYGDQDSNMRQSEYNGFALTLEFGELTEEYVLNAINKMLTNPTYAHLSVFYFAIIPISEYDILKNYLTTFL